MGTTWTFMIVELGPFALQCFKQDFRLNSGLWFFRFNISDLILIENLQTTNRSLRLCPNFGESSPRSIVFRLQAYRNIHKEWLRQCEQHHGHTLSH